VEIVDGSRKRMAALRRPWPDFIRFEDPAPQNVTGGRRALQFRAAFPMVGEELLAQLSLASQLLETMVYEIDAVLDGDRAPALSPLDLAAIQFEAYRIFADLFPGGSAAWSALRVGLVELAEVLSMQRAYADGRRNLLELSASDATVLARGKTSMARAINVALGELAGQQDVAERIGRSIDHLMVAGCLADDIDDWRKDAEHGQPSYVLARAGTLARVGPRPAGGWSLADIERIGHCVYFAGVAREVTGIALDHVRRAREGVADLPLSEWTAWMDFVAERIQAISRALPEAPRPDSDRRMQAALSVTLPIIQDRPWWTRARACLVWLLRQWRLSFPDLRAAQRSTANRRTTNIPVTDILGRAVLANTLAAADAAMASGQLRAWVQRDAAVLVSRFQAMFEQPAADLDWTSLPCALDEVAEIVRLLATTGQRDFHLFSIDAMLDALAAGGAGKHDPDLAANLLSAVALGRPMASHRGIDALVDDILAAQTPTGQWSSRHYHGSLYSTYQCIQALATFRPGAVDSLSRAEEFVLAQQRADGGWSTEESVTSDSLGTASALLALAAAGTNPTLQAQREEAAGRALQWLDRQARPDGSYALVPFVRIDPEDLRGLHLPTSLGSQSITTALVCQAALAWDRP
jgi:hypothetical protein